MSITFGGLATGLDTNAIVKQLMELERQPINRLQKDKAWFGARQSAYGALDGKLQDFLSNIKNLASSDDLRKKSVSASSEDFFSVTADPDALPGASYQIEVVSLAQVQKDVSQGYASKTDQNFGQGELTLTVGDDGPVTITIDATNNSLEGIAQAINDADAGVNASIINDGTDSPYRLVLTGDEVATAFSLASNLPTNNGDVSAQLQSGGFASQEDDYFGGGTLDISTGQTITLSESANSLTDVVDAINAETAATGVTASLVPDGGNYVISLDNGATITSTNFSGGYDSLDLIQTQASSQAHVRVDTIDIYSDGNTLDGAIPGLSLDLTQAEAGTITSVSVKLDEAAIKSQIEDFVKGYNDVMAFIGSQSAKDGSSGGILNGDAGINTIKRRLQSLLTATNSTTGSFVALSQIGLETQRDGTIKLDDETLTDVIQNNLESLEKLFVGEGNSEGIFAKFQDYVEGKTDSIDGFYAANKKSAQSNLRRIDERIQQIEIRLEKKERTMLKKFSAMEELVSGMNSQSDFLTSQLKGLENLWSYNR
ncbi:MAG: hypothetical protein DRO01_07135 [Thermoproteota archaeon]|nr:MAG: hypothetical protein DRO01_07135 [Candidatus Korarchaeota archaeon]